VNNAMATLANKGLVINEKYKEVLLTSAGLKQAKMTSKKHNTLLDFFTKILKVNEDIADKDACSIEHVISNDTINAMQEYLNNIKSINS
ncbi:MAG: metal-dependent transcriptional regulator, partial [Clostridiales bacterium]|nr:metal-dependent transcriptional regulator [Clostridiales bacterium]